MSTAEYKELAFFDQKNVREALGTIQDKYVFVGFDAFLDSIVSPIAKGNALQPEDFFETMRDFGHYIASKDGENCSIELYEKSVKIGGNMAISAHAISSFGVSSYCIGTFGYPQIHPMFVQMHPRCQLVSVGDPGVCTALEFRNGKVMLGVNKGVNLLDWLMVKERAGLDHIIDCVKASDVLCFLNWSELPGATSIIQGMRDEVLSQITGEKRLLVDFSDCSRRAHRETSEILSIIARMPPHIKISLSLNKNEETIICGVLDIYGGTYEEKGRAMIERLNLDAVFFHNRDMNCLVTRDGVFEEASEICKKPAVSAGAGDNFNAGICVSMLMNLPPKEALHFAVKTAEYYVSHGTSYIFKPL